MNDVEIPWDKPALRPGDAAAFLRPRTWWRHEHVTEGLPPHLVDKLIAAGMKTVGDVAEAGEDKLRAIDGVGHLGMKKIRRWLVHLEAKANGKAECSESSSASPKTP